MTKVKNGQSWSNIVNHSQTWSNPVNHGQIWLDLVFWVIGDMLGDILAASHFV